MVFKFESRAEATALLKRRSRDAAVALLTKEFTAQRWTLRKELKLSVRPLVTLRYFRRAVGAVRAPAPGARELCAGGAVLVVELDRATGGLVQAAQPYYTPALEAAGHYTIASVGADGFNEAPYVYRHAHNGVDYYYLFVNWFACCAREQSTYVLRVGRSTSPTGPFFDDQGIQMNEDDKRTVSSPVEDGAMVPAGGGRLPAAGRPLAAGRRRHKFIKNG